MEDKAPYEEKSYHEWLTDALARDEQTWTALEEKLSRLRVKRGEKDGAARRRD